MRAPSLVIKPLGDDTIDCIDNDNCASAFEIVDNCTNDFEVDDDGCASVFDIINSYVNDF